MRAIRIFMTFLFNVTKSNDAMLYERLNMIPHKHIKKNYNLHYNEIATKLIKSKLIV